MPKERPYSKKHSDKDEELIAQLLIEVAVYARLAQHLAWEMQYAFNGLELLEVDCEPMKKIKNKIFNLASDMPIPLQKRYNDEIDDQSSRHVSLSYILQDVYHNQDNLSEIDAILRKKAKKIYEKAPLDFDYGFDIPVISRRDCVGEGKLDKWLGREPEKEPEEGERG